WIRNNPRRRVVFRAFRGGLVWGSRLAPIAMATWFVAAQACRITNSSAVVDGAATKEESSGIAQARSTDGRPAPLDHVGSQADAPSHVQVDPEAPTNAAPEYEVAGHHIALGVRDNACLV